MTDPEPGWVPADRTTAADRIPINPEAEPVDLASRYNQRIESPRRWPHVASFNLRECPACYAVVADVRGGFAHVEKAHNQRERAHYLDEWAQDLAAELAELRGGTARYRRRLWGPEWVRNRPVRARRLAWREMWRAVWQGRDYGKQAAGGEAPRKADLEGMAKRYGHLLGKGSDDE